MTLRRFAIVYFLATGLGTAAWWVMLFAWPASRAPFKLSAAPDESLLAFAIPDALLFIGTALGIAVAIGRRARWSRPLLYVHAGAAGYAGLYCLSLTIISTGEAWLAMLLMLPSLVVPGFVLWRTRMGWPS